MSHGEIDDPRAVDELLEWFKEQMLCPFCAVRVMTKAIAALNETFEDVIAERELPHHDSPPTSPN
jgi:hypothetical protein